MKHAPTPLPDDVPSERWEKLLGLSYIDDVKQFWTAVVAFIQDIAPHRIAVVSFGYSTLVFHDGQVYNNSDDGQVLRTGQIYTDLNHAYVMGVSSIGADQFRRTQAFYNPLTRKHLCEQLTVFSTHDFAMSSKIKNVASIVIYHEADPGFRRLKAIQFFQSHIQRIIRSFLARITKIEIQVGLNDFASNLPIGMILLGFDNRVLFVNAEGYRQSYLWNVAPRTKVLSDYKTKFSVPGDILASIRELAHRWNQVALLLRLDDTVETVTIHPQNSTFSATIKAIVDRSNPLAVPNFLVRYSVINSQAKLNTFEADDLNISLLAELTNAERKVALYVVRGYSNKEIADLLGRQASTIKEHLTHIYDKLNVRNRTHMIGRLLERSVREDPPTHEENGVIPFLHYPYAETGNVD